MKLTRLRISGFKSFAEPCELEIADGLTGIVGPNGCGKSNIVEALRWVMGESSARGLRGAGMEDVIFAGTATRPPFDFAEVVLGLEGPVAEIAAPGETLELSRRITRGGGSTFRLRGREVRARDVQIMFADAASGARSAAIVGQGEIARIVDAKPDHRRRLLEEAAGIGGLHVRRREAELRLQATARNLELLEQRLAQLAEQRSRLARQAREGERYRKLQAELRRLEGLRLLARWRGEERALGEAEARLGQVEGELAELSRRRAALQREQAVAETEARQFGERRAALAAELARLEERLAAEARLAEEERRARDAARARLAAIDSVLARESEAVAEARARLGTVETRGRRLAAALPDLEAECRREEAAVREQGERLAELERALEQATVRALRREAALSAVRVRLRELGERRAALAAAAPGETPAGHEEAVGTLRQAVDDLERGLAESEERIRRLEDERARLEAARERAAAALATAETAADAAAERRREAEAALRERRAAVRALVEKRDLLDRQLERLGERLSRLDDAAAGLVPAEAEGRLAEAREALAAREGERAALRRAVEEVQERVERAREALSAVEIECREAATVCTRLESEIEALGRLLPDTPADALLHRLRVPEERARAIAALLGDDLLLGTDPTADSFWREEVGGRPVDAQPGPPEGCEPLVHGLDLPPALIRVLAAAGFVDNGEAERLQPRLRAGQSLVSRDGGLWRWDGLVRRPGATDEAARRLAVERRLAASRQLLAEARARLDARERARHERAQACRAVEVEAERLRWQLVETEEAHRRLGAEVAAMERAAAVARERQAEIERERATLVGEREEAEAERRRLEARIAELDDRNRLSATVDLARAAERRATDGRDGLRAELAELGRRLRELERRTGAAREERAACERALSERRSELQDAEARLARAREEARRRAEELARLDAERAELDVEAERLAQQHGGLEEERQRSLAARDAARCACDEARSRLEALVERRRTAVAEAERLAAERQHLAAALAAAEERLAAARQEREAVAEELARRQRAATATSGAEGAEDRRGRLRAALAELAERADAARARAEECARALEAVATDIAGSRERAALLRAEATRARRARAEIASEIEKRAGRSVEAVLAEGGEALRAELDGLDPADLAERVERLRRARERLGAVNLRAARELAEVERELETGRGEEAELRAAIDRLRRAIGRLEREGRERLLAVHAEVERHFRALFARLFGGGRAELRLAEGEDPFAAGLELDAMPPGKKLQHVSLLSGGEKSLAGLALVFAFFLARPSPLCVLDEVDAALDDANVERFVDLLAEIARGTGTRFLVVTHHPLTMARMDRLYGVTMAERGVSRLVSVALERAVELRATA